MKRLLVIAAVAGILTSCGGGEDADAAEAKRIQDSVKRAADSVEQTGDTTDLNGAFGDTTSASGIHGGGSGSEVGGGATGGPQGKGSDSTR